MQRRDNRKFLSCLLALHRVDANLWIQSLMSTITSIFFSAKDLLGLVKIASINNSITQTSYYFLGAVNKWRYIMAKDFPGKETKKD